jgi:hypothetical protein
MAVLLILRNPFESNWYKIFWGFMISPYGTQYHFYCSQYPILKWVRVLLLRKVN